MNNTDSKAVSPGMRVALHHVALEMKGARCNMSRIMRKMETTLMILPFLALMLANPLSTHAQGRLDDAGKAQEALQKTDEVISSARGVIEESRSQKGRLALEVAVQMQARAWSGFRSQGYLMALKLTIKAREEAWHAIALARSDAQFEQNHTRIAEDTYERLARLRELMIETGVRDEQAMRLMEQARNLLEQSRLNSQQLHYQLALKLANNAQQLASRAEERIRNTRALKETAERRLALLERLIERSRERAREAEGDPVRVQLRLAEEQLDRGRELLKSGRYREAKQAFERCERALRNSARFMPAQTALDPQNRLQEAYRLLERAGELAAEKGTPPDPKTLEIMEQARAMLRRAEDAIAAGHTDEALGLVARSREMLRMAVRAEEGEMTRERLMLRLENVEALREETRNLAEKCPAPGIAELMGRAQEHLRLAREHGERGNLESAVAEMAIARNLYQRISEICAR